jgi:CHASE2 domain-containing sensor protein
MKRRPKDEIRDGRRLNVAVRAWRHSKFLRTFVRNLILASAIEFVFLPIVGPLLGVSRVEQGALDLMMQFFSNTNRIQYREIPAAFTWIDLDDASMKAWGDPALTPRDKLLDLIRYTARNGARTIVVDSNFSRSYKMFGPDYARAEDGLQKFLSDYSREGTVAPIVLVRANSLDPDEHGSTCPILQQSFLDESEFLPDSIQWAVVRFDIDSDFILRRWRLFERLCQDSRPRVLPSVQLAVTADVTDVRGFTDLNHWLLQFRPQSCTACSENPPGLLGWRNLLDQLAQHKQEAEPLRLKSVQIDPDTDELEQRIVFRLPYMRASDRRSYALVKVQDQPEQTPVLDVLPAQDFLEAMDKAPATERLRGRIVFIGASFHDSGDWFATPLGRMPGVLVLINATYSLMEYGHLHEKSARREIIDLMVLVTGMTLIFTFVSGVWGLWLPTILVIVYLVPNSFVLFQQGRWLDFTVPLVGVELHHLVDFFVERYEISGRDPTPTGDRL